MYKISENLTILNIGHKKRDPHCSPSHTKMAASAWPGGGETAAADENKFCSTVLNKIWHNAAAGSVLHTGPVKDSLQQYNC